MLLLLLFNTPLWALKLPNVGVIKMTYTLESTNLKNNSLDNSSKTIAKAVSYIPLSPIPNIHIDFSELETKMMNSITNNPTDTISEKVTYVFNGNIWKKILFSSVYNGKTYANSQVCLSKDVPSPIDTLEEYYTGNCFLPNGFYFFRVKKFTILDALNGKIKYPKVNISRTKEFIELSATTPTNKIQTLLDTKKGYPILRNYTNVYIDEKNSEYLKIENKFLGEIIIKNLGIYVPNTLERTLIRLDTKTGFQITIRITDLEYLKSFDFKAATPKIPVGWTIIDLDRNITYKNGASPDEILKSIISIK